MVGGEVGLVDADEDRPDPASAPLDALPDPEDAEPPDWPESLDDELADDESAARSVSLELSEPPETAAPIPTPATRTAITRAAMRSGRPLEPLGAGGVVVNGGIDVGGAFAGAPTVGAVAPDEAAGLPVAELVVGVEVLLGAPGAATGGVGGAGSLVVPEAGVDGVVGVAVVGALAGAGAAAGAGAVAGGVGGEGSVVGVAMIGVTIVALAGSSTISPHAVQKSASASSDSPHDAQLVLTSPPPRRPLDAPDLTASR